MAIIGLIFIFGLFYNGETFNKNMQGNYSSVAINGTFVESGTEKSLATSENEYSFSTNETQGIMAIVIAVSVIGSIIGIRVLGSGLSEITIKILYNTIFFYGVWALFSVFSLGLLLLIPIGGWIIYFILTGMLSFGIVQQINSSSGINV
jgi:hypothetical protein